MQEQRDEIVKLVTERLEAVTSDYPEITGIRLGGSHAKDTWLEGADIDIFVHFTPKTPMAELGRMGRTVGFGALKGFDPYVRYSEHPYVEALVNDTKVNIVPCYMVKKGRWKSSADRSQFHTKFMQKHLTRPLQNEVRLLKQFLHAGHLYGAEISVQGFSGYLTEVLIYRLGSFAKVASRFASISHGTVIGNALKQFNTPVVIVDPVDGNRNLAAAISAQNLSKFILMCRAYVQSPSLKFFTHAPPSKVPPLLVTVQFNYSDRGADIIWGQIKKAVAVITTQLRRAGFTVLRDAAVTDENGTAVLAFVFESFDILPTEVHHGPAVWNKNACEGFMAKRKPSYVWINREGSLVSLERRRFVDCTKFLRHLLGPGLDSSGVPPGIKDDVAAGICISRTGRRLDKSIRDKLGVLVTTDAKIFS